MAIPVWISALGSQNICRVAVSKDIQIPQTQASPLLLSRPKECQAIDGIQYIKYMPVFAGLAVPSFAESIYHTMSIGEWGNGER